MKLLNIAILVLGAGLTLGGFFWRKSACRRRAAQPDKRNGRAKTWSTIMLIVGVWAFAEQLLLLALGEAERFSIVMMPRMQIGPLDVSFTVVVCWLILAVLIVGIVLLRLLVIPKLTERPRGIQTILEASVRCLSGLTKTKAAKIGVIAAVVALAWILVRSLLHLAFGPMPPEEFTVSLWAPRVQVGSFSLSSTVILTWVVMAVLIVMALLIRIFVIPRMKEQPHGLQNVLEMVVEAVCNFTRTNVGDLSKNLPAYLFSLALFMVGCALVELFGYRAPTADITMTFSMALITFVLINFYGIKKKGIKGRILSMAKPTPVIFPIKVVTDIAIPVSLACRLFGNMLGGMIVMDLLYFALGSSAVGIPSALGLYFNVFHPLIQTYIFLTLTLTFINEAVE